MWGFSKKEKKSMRAPADDVPLSSKEKSLLEALLAVLENNNTEDTPVDELRATQLMRSLHRENKTDLLDKAVKWNQNDAKWRKEVQPEKFIEGSDEFHSTLPKCPYYIYGQDRKGHPVWYDFAPDDMTILENMTKEQQLERQCRPFEQLSVLKAQMRKQYGNNLYQHVYVMDVGNIGLSTCTNKAFRENLKFKFDLLAAHYAEVADMIFIINASMAFRAAWKVVSLWVDPGTLEKVKVYGSDGVKKLVKWSIDIDQIPPKLGGKGAKQWELGEITLLKSPIPVSVSYSKPNGGRGASGGAAISKS